jgi:hypothetical protein
VVIIVIILALLALGALLWALYLVWRRGDSGRGTGDGIFARLWESLDPRITSYDAWAENTTLTLRRLIMASILFGATIAAWAAAASVMRTIWLYQPGGPAGIAAGELTKRLEDWSTWAFALFQIVRGVGGTLALCAAAGLAGAALGFLFGLPKPPDNNFVVLDKDSSGKPKDPNQQSGLNWRLNSNLMDISDWLTKAIVGVSLFEAQRAFGLFGGKAQVVAQWLFDSRHGSYVVLPAALAGAAVLGFLFTNLHTQLVVSGLIAQADRHLKSLPGRVTRTTLNNIKGIREGLVPRIARALNVPEPQDQPTPDEVEAALEYVGITYDDLKSRPDFTDQDMRSWARAKAVLNDYREAARGYMYLLGKNRNG